MEYRRWSWYTRNAAALVHADGKLVLGSVATTDRFMVKLDLPDTPGNRCFDTMAAIVEEVGNVKWASYSPAACTHLQCAV